MIRFIHWLYRSAITGRFISRKEAEEHPETSVRERLRDEDEPVSVEPTP